MMHELKRQILVVLTGLILIVPSISAGAASPVACTSVNPDTPAGCTEVITSSLPKTSASTDVINTILSIVFAITGALSLLTITISGFRFVISRGDSQRVAQARGAIIYAIVGLIIAISGMAIETFVINKT